MTLPNDEKQIRLKRRMICRHLIWALAALMMLLTHGCAVTPKTLSIKDHPTRLMENTILKTDTASVVSRQQLIADLAEVRVVYAGESHTNPSHHAIQLEIIKALAHEPVDPSPETSALSQVVALLRRQLAALRAGRIPLEALLVSQKLSRTLDKYRTPSPVARAVAQLEAVGKSTTPGQRIRFLLGELAAPSYERLIRDAGHGHGRGEGAVSLAQGSEIGCLHHVRIDANAEEPLQAGKGTKLIADQIFVPQLQVVIRVPG